MKRVALGLISVSALTALVSGATFALFNASVTNDKNTFASGTVSLSGSTATLFQVDNMAPGDLNWNTWAVSYTGSLDAWIGLDAAQTGDLTTCGGGNFYTFLSNDWWDWNVLDPAQSSVANQFPTYVSNGDTINYWVAPYLGWSAGNDCQKKTAKLSLTVHAVQASNNTNWDYSGPWSWGTDGTATGKGAKATDMKVAKASFQRAHTKSTKTQVDPEALLKNLKAGKQ